MKAKRLETFLIAVRGVYSSGAGTKETSYYTALDNLLDGVGGGLKPRVHCVMQLKNLGAGNPDGGFFTADQFDRKTGSPKDLTAPSRGVLEVKPPSESVESTSTTKQIERYWDRYKLVLVTNMRDWLLIGERDGKRVNLERFSLAKDETTFFELAATASKTQDTLGGPFEDFLARVLCHNAPLAEPQDLAWLMASYAREARYRVALAGDDGRKQLTALKSSFETALGVTFGTEEGELFFQSSLVQTLFYGLFAAWVLRHEIGAKGEFDWRTAAYDLHVPMISALFEQLSQPSKLKALGLTEVMDWTADALNRVDKPQFFTKFETKKSVQYFYEPFLEAFDPDLRKELGVWYTPEEIVRYQVARVDETLRNELGVADGLADPNVVILDPCCGTGAYLVEALNTISKTLKAHGAGSLLAHEIKKAAMTRIFGFELLPAPYVISHLQLGLALRHSGAALEDDERAAIYLTNALTGWKPLAAPKTKVLPFPEFQVEKDAADEIKRTQKILVILGNPPYNAFSGVGLGEEQDLVAPYKVGLIKKWGIRKFNLDDLYVRFFRLAERRIGEEGTRGIVSFISNYSWTTEPSFVVLREHLLSNFDQFWIENMHGNRKMSEYAPDGHTSETLFARRGFSPGIQQGVVISLWVKKDAQFKPKPMVRYRDDLEDAKAEERRATLLKSLSDSDRLTHYQLASPSAQNRFSFRPGDAAKDYMAWPQLPDFASQLPFPGLEECRSGDLFDSDRALLEKRIQRYFDKSIPLDQLADIVPGLSRKAAGFDPTKARNRLLSAEAFQKDNVVRFAVRPFDTQWCYYTGVQPIWNRARPDLWKQFPDNRFIVSRLNTAADPEGVPMTITSALMDKQMISRNPGAIPLVIYQKKAGGEDYFATTQANLSAQARGYLEALCLPDPDKESAVADLMWMHALAVAYSPAYVNENLDGLRQGWPRIPVPREKEDLERSAQLGRAVSDLLNVDKAVPGVTSGTIRPELSNIGVVSRIGGGTLKPEEFCVEGGWGRPGKRGVVMPGKGKLSEREPEAGELIADLGVKTLDIFLNNVAYWKNIPLPVWEFYIGGYQVMKKWLSYRERSMLGRCLSVDEVRAVTEMARRLAALVLLQKDLDKNYSSIAAKTYAWKATGP